MDSVKNPVPLKAEVSPAIEDSAASFQKTDTDKQQYWLSEIASASKREKTWRSDAKKIVQLYEADKDKEYQYNILYSNTETLMPALYNNTPTPIYQRRFADEDPIGKMVCEAGQRMASYQIDSNEECYSNFDGLMEQAVLEALVPGRGVTRWKYEAQITKPKQGPTEEEAAAQAAAGVESPPDDASAAVPDEEVTYEAIVGEEVPWDRVHFGYAKKWKDVPWVSFDHYMDREDLVHNFGEKLGAAIPLTIAETQAEQLADDNTDDTGPSDNSMGDTTPSLTLVREIWDKKARKVIFVTDAWPVPVRETEDPFNLAGFYPIPEPLVFFRKIRTMVPTPLYKQYKSQHKELNNITLRINRIVLAMKVRGFYDARMGELNELFEQPENTLLPLNSVATVQDIKTLDNAIWLMPLDKLITVLQQLYLQRQQIKQVIYEITGISDILRGSTVASETATAQNLKSQWGSLRLRKMQKKVMRYVRNNLILMAELSGKLAEDTWAKVTGLPYLSGAQKQQLQQQLASMQPVVQQMQAVGQQMAASGQQPPPQAMQQFQQMQAQMQQMQEQLAQPGWDEVLGVFRDRLTRDYHVDIETDSTVELQATEDIADIEKVMAAIGQVMNGLAPLIQSGALPFQAAQAMLLTIIRKYRFGPQIEEYIKQMKAPTPQDDGGAAKAQADEKAAQATLQAEMQKFQMEMQQKDQQFQMQLQADAQQKALDRQNALEIEQIKAQSELAKEQQRLSAAAMESEKDARRLQSENTRNRNDDVGKLLQGIQAALQDHAKGKAEGADAESNTAALAQALSTAINAPRVITIKRDGGGAISGGESAPSNVQ